MTPCQVLYVGDDYCGSVVGPIAVIIGRDRPGPALPAHGMAWTKRLAAEYPSGCGFMIVLRSSAPPPNDDTRTRVSGFFDSCSKNATAGAVVIEGDGFVAASIRGFFGAYSLMNFRFRLRVHGTVAEAAPAMMKRLGRDAPNEAADLVKRIEDLKSRYAAGTLEAR
jgi:hypothetical protein